jgi:hypothetical protein
MTNEDRIKALTKYIEALEDRLIQMKMDYDTQSRELKQEKDKNATLLRLMDELEREKWSFQSELENLRGY